MKFKRFELTQPMRTADCKVRPGHACIVSFFRAESPAPT